MTNVLGDFKSLKREEVLKAEVADLVPWVEHLILDRSPDQLLKEFGDQLEQFVLVCQALILKFIIEYFKAGSKPKSTAEHSNNEEAHGVAEDALSKVRHSAVERLQQNHLHSRFDPLQKAAVEIQAAWRTRKAQQQVDHQLLSIVFEESPTPRLSQRCSGGPASWLRPQRPNTAGAASISEAVRSVRVTRRTVAKVMSRLKQNGLDVVVAFRCADKSYPKGGGVMPIGQYIMFLLQDQRVALLPAEQTMLLRLLSQAGRRHSHPLGLPFDASYAIEAPVSGSVQDGGSTVGERSGVLQESWHWEMQYHHALELAHGFHISSDPLSHSAPWRSPLLAVRDALVAAGDVGLQWGRRKPSWRSLLLDAHVSQLLEEHQRLKALADGAGHHEHRKESDILRQMEVCEAQLVAAGKSGASPLVAVPVVIARLLQESLKGIAPVTVHAAIHLASEHTCERREGVTRLRYVSNDSGSVEQSCVEFDAPLHAAPSLLHLSAAASGDRFKVDLESLSAHGMRLRIWKETGSLSRSWASKLRVRYCAGAASGTARIHSIINLASAERSRSSEGQSNLQHAGCERYGSVEANFVPHLGRAPAYVLIETFQIAGNAVVAAPGGLVVKRPNARGFIIELPLGPGSVGLKDSIRYEAVSIEPVVRAPKLQELAELPHVPVDDDGEVAKLLPESSSLREDLHDAASSLLDDAGDEYDEYGEDGEEESLPDDGSQFEALKSRLNRRAQQCLLHQQRLARTALATTSTTTPLPVVHQPEPVASTKKQMQHTQTSS